MTVRDDFDRLLAVWLDETAGAGAPDYLDETLDGLARIRQRPAWMSPGRWLPMQLTMPRVAIPRALSILAVVALLLAALIAVGLMVGSQRPLPPPFGLAATGMFVYDSGGDLFLATTDGESVRPLIREPGEEFGATFSRDGTRVAYWAKPVTGPPLLRVVGADGSGARTVSGSLQVMIDPTFPAVDWAPDGRTVAFSASTGELYVLDVDGSAEPRRIGEGPLRRFEPAWSPDGGLIAFRGDGDAEIRGVYVIAADGSGETRVSATVGNDPAFPDRHPVWSSDGRLAYHIAVVGGVDNDIFIADRSSTGWIERKIVFQQTVEPSLDSWPVWSNDADRISFVRSPTDNNGHLMVADADGSNAGRIGHWIAGFSPVCWTPDDRAIVAVNAELDVMIGNEAEPGYRIVHLDHSINPILISSPGRQSFGACSWQRLAVE